MAWRYNVVHNKMYTWFYFDHFVYIHLSKGFVVNCPSALLHWYQTINICYITCWWAGNTEVFHIGKQLDLMTMNMNKYLKFITLNGSVFFKKAQWIVFTRGQFWPSGNVVECVCVCVCQAVCQSFACPCDNPGPIQARNTKFRPEVQNNLFKVSIVLWSDRPWPSRSNLRSKSKCIAFWACTHHNSLSFQAWTTKFGPEVQNT